MANTVLEAIREGIWDFEPDHRGEEDYSATKALPGSNEKLEVLARRLAEGLPLWHPDDCKTFMDANAE